MEVIVIVIVISIGIWIMMGKPQIFKKEEKNSFQDLAKAFAEFSSEDDATSIVLKSKSIPNAQGLYGLSPENPICCGNMMNMEYYYSRLLYKDEKLDVYNTSAFYSESESLGVRSRHYLHGKFKDDRDIPTIYLTKEYFYEGFKKTLPDNEHFSTSIRSFL